MDKSQFESNIKSSLQVMLYLYQTMHGRNSEPKITNLQFSYYKAQDVNCEVSFDTEYKFAIDDPDVSSYTRGLNECNKKQYGFFSGVEILQNGEFGKRVIPHDESDDIIGYFKSCEYEWGYGESVCKATFSYAYHYFFNENS